MPIKGFRTREKVRPIVDVKIGALVPVGCKEKLIYAESPDYNKCTNRKDGECPFVKKTGRFKKTGPETTCPMACKTLSQLDQMGIYSRPMQLGYFLMPEDYRVQLGLPERPTVIPNIMVISDHDVSKGLVEPLEALYRYPVFPYELSWWSKTACICRGDGQTATMYPFDRTHPDHGKQRECLYEECPDFGPKKCKTYGELYFAVPDAPGFPGLWRIATRSPNSIGDIITGLKNVHDGLWGVVSRIPLKLILREGQGHPKDADGKRFTTQIFTLDIKSNINYVQSSQVITAIANQVREIGGAGPLMLEAPKEQPAPHPPVEQEATADPSQWDSDFVPEQSGEPTPTQPTPAQKPAQPAQQPSEKPKAQRTRGGAAKAEVDVDIAAQQAAAQQAAAQISADDSETEAVEGEVVKPDWLVKAEALEAKMIRQTEMCVAAGDVTRVYEQFKGEMLSYIKGYGYNPEKYKAVRAEMTAKLPAKPETLDKKEAREADAAAKQAPAVVAKRTLLASHIISPKNPQGIIPNEQYILDVVNRSTRKTGKKAESIEDLTEQEIDQILMMIEKARKK